MSMKRNMNSLKTQIVNTTVDSKNKVSKFLFNDLEILDESDHQSEEAEEPQIEETEQHEDEKYVKFL